MRYFLHISYDGSSFHGWQRQSGVMSVQESMENALFTILRAKVNCIGCGRTDKGVHASQFFAHFDFSNELNDQIVGKLNAVLPRGISINELIPVKEKSHTQHDAMWRTYKFLVHTHKNPFLKKYSSEYLGKHLDEDLMKEYCKYISAQKDFKNLCKHPDIYHTTICDIQNVSLYVHREDQRLMLEVKSNRFLRAMMRLIMQKMMEVASGEIPLSSFKAQFESKEAIENLKPFYPDGLYLTSVEYDYIHSKPVTESNPFLKLYDSQYWEKLL